MLLDSNKISSFFSYFYFQTALEHLTNCPTGTRLEEHLKAAAGHRTDANRELERAHSEVTDQTEKKAALLIPALWCLIYKTVRPTGSRNTVSDRDSGKYTHSSSEPNNNAAFWYTDILLTWIQTKTFYFNLVLLISKAACRVTSEKIRHSVLRTWNTQLRQ